MLNPAHERLREQLSRNLKQVSELEEPPARIHVPVLRFCQAFTRQDLLKPRARSAAGAGASDLLPKQRRFTPGFEDTSGEEHEVFKCVFHFLLCVR